MLFFSWLELSGRKSKLTIALTFGDTKLLPNAIYVILHLYRMYSGKKNSLNKYDGVDVDDVPLEIALIISYVIVLDMEIVVNSYHLKTHVVK